VIIADFMKQNSMIVNLILSLGLSDNLDIAQNMLDTFKMFCQASYDSDGGEITRMFQEKINKAKEGIG